MKKKDKKGLALVKKTLRDLTQTKLTQAVGGIKLCDSDSEKVEEELG